MKLLLFLLLKTLVANNVILSSGLQDWNRSQLLEQYNMYSMYSDMGIITSSSILVYNLDEKGNLDTYKTNDTSVTAEEYQLMIKQEIGLLALPCLFCDATTGYCTNLNDRLEKLYKNQTYFVTITIEKIMSNHWDGFVVDFEPDSQINWEKLTTFLILWSQALAIINKPLYVWIGFRTLYDYRIYSAPNIKLLSMNTYVSTYGEFIDMATSSLTKLYNTTKIGFGLLTSENMPEKDMMKVVEWCEVARIKLATNAGIAPSIISIEENKVTMEKFPTTLGNYKGKDISKKIRRLISKLHDLGIIHGDLHSHNIVVDPSTEEVRLIDYGRSYFETEITKPILRMIGKSMNKEFGSVEELMEFEEKLY